MFNPLLESCIAYTDAELRNRIMEVTRKYYLTRDVNIRAQLAQMLEVYSQEESTRLSNPSVEDSETFEGLISIN